MSCPICKRATVPAFKPFCSRRCADVDLARWLKGEYAIPGPEVEELPDLDPDDSP
ncbi:MAG: DNA gyrase inhibitor YacG [Rhodobacteraceae bacterium]|nr:DNA gyrase inhibitor YacG [Paracoccaceae bacterium]